MQIVHLVILAAGLLASLSVSSQSPLAPLPAGASEQVTQGGRLYRENCALCHGANGRDATVFPRPIWGVGHDIAKFGTAKGLFDYLQLMMPFDDPSKIDDSQKTAIVAYMLVRNGDLPAATVLPTGGTGAAIK
ncbi:MAG: c-type cytochrome [Betaproteobacteria bacterium]|jgi:mono/diheme cytochrome c family protein